MTNKDKHICICILVVGLGGTACGETNPLFIGCQMEAAPVNGDADSAHERQSQPARRGLLKSCLMVTLAYFLISVTFGVGLVLLLAYLMGHEQLASFQVNPWTINVYAEGDFHYEPPGYIYFELKQWGQSRITERRFMGVGPERKPSQRFRLVMTPDREIVAIVLGNEVQMIHEFSSGYTWPGPYTNVTEPQWQMAELLLQRLRAANPEISCPRQDGYRRELDRDREPR